MYGASGMPEGPPPERRIWVAVTLVVLAAILLHASGRRQTVPSRLPLASLPMTIGEWRATDQPLPDRIVTAAGFSDYVNRDYTDGKGAHIGVYVGYYSTQQSGDQIHTPRNCLPAAGWEPVRTGRLQVSVGRSSPVWINDFLIAKGIDRALVLYWYQGRGRIVASEFSAKFWMIADALIRHRTDGSLVRLTLPVSDTEEHARELVLPFLREIYPHLNSVIPE